jgi:Uncharacterized protein conserved in bacteria (DUF2188)
MALPCITELTDGDHGEADAMEVIHQLVDFVPAASSDGLPAIVYDVVRHRGSWRVLHVGRYSAPYASQHAAIDAATRAATQEMANGRNVTVRLNRTDGQVFDLVSSAEHA